MKANNEKAKQEEEDDDPCFDELDDFLLGDKVEQRKKGKEKAPWEIKAEEEVKQKSSINKREMFKKKQVASLEVNSTPSLISVGS